MLIVDDDEETLDLSRRLVLQAKPAANVVLAKDASHAMAFLLGASRPNGDVPLPTLMLLDINMPGVGGFEVLRWVRRNKSLAAVKVVMLSTSDCPADIKRATELGAHGYLIKFPGVAVLECVLNQACLPVDPPGSPRPDETNLQDGAHRLVPSASAT